MKSQQFALNFRPMKRRDADTPKAVVSELFDQVGGIKEVMFRFDIGKSQAYAYTDETTKEQISFARVVSLTTPGSPAAAEFLASRAGGVLRAARHNRGLSDQPHCRLHARARRGHRGHARNAEGQTADTGRQGEGGQGNRRVDLRAHRAARSLHRRRPVTAVGRTTGAPLSPT